MHIIYSRFIRSALLCTAGNSNVEGKEHWKRVLRNSRLKGSPQLLPNLWKSVWSLKLYTSPLNQGK